MHQRINFNKIRQYEYTAEVFMI